MGNIKDWGNVFPAQKNTRGGGSPSMEMLNNNADDTRVSQANALADAQIAVEDIVGDDSEPAGSLRQRVTTLEASSGTDEKAKATVADTTADYLAAKLSGGTGINKSTIDKGAGDLAIEFAADFGSGAGKVCQGDDSRLSDDRNPTAHMHPASEVSDFDTEVSNNADVGANTTHRGVSTGNPHSVSKSDVGLTNVEDLKVKLDATAPPGVGDDSGDGYSVGSRWIDVSADKEYVCLDATVGNAVWTETTGAGGGASPLTTKGDLFTYDTGDQRLPVGSDGQILVPDSGEATGLKWKDLGVFAPAVIDVDDDYPSSSVVLDTTNTYKQIYPGATARTFIPMTTGEHPVILDCDGYVSNDANSENFQFKVEFDDGVNPPVVVGDDNVWFWRKYTNAAAIYRSFRYSGVAQLEAGVSYDVKAYGKRVGSAASSVTIPNSNRSVQVTISSVSGSGAAGEIIDSTALTAGPLTISAADPSYQDLDTITIDVAEGEQVTVNFVGIGRTSSGAAYMAVRAYDVTNSNEIARATAYTPAGAQHENLAFSKKTEPLSAGSVTIKIQANYQTTQWGLVSYGWDVVQDRGGLVPIRDGGTQRQDKPVAVDFRDGLGAEDDSGVVKVYADTKSWKGVWQVGAVTVQFAARNGQPSTTRLTLQDGKQRTSSGTLTWAIANGVADLGYDEAASQGNSKVLYFYAVPSSGDDNVLTVRASDNDPASGGPTGYSNWKLVWATYINGSGNLIKVYQRGNHFSWISDMLTVAPTYDATVRTMSLVDLIPLSAEEADVVVRIDGVSGAETVKVWADGDGNPATVAQYLHAAAAGEIQTATFTIPTHTTPKQFDYHGTSGASSWNWVVNGWHDSWIDP